MLVIQLLIKKDGVEARTLFEDDVAGMVSMMRYWESTDWKVQMEECFEIPDSVH